MKTVANCNSIFIRTHEEKIYNAYQRCKGKIERKAYYLTRSKNNIEDITQEVFLKFWLKWPVLNTLPENNLEDYIYAMVRNRVINLQKKESMMRKNMNGYSNEQSNIYFHDEMVLLEGIKLYNVAVDQLPAKQKKCICFVTIPMLG